MFQIISLCLHFNLWFKPLRKQTWSEKNLWIPFNHKVFSFENLSKVVRGFYPQSIAENNVTFVNKTFHKFDHLIYTFASSETSFQSGSILFLLTCRRCHPRLNFGCETVTGREDQKHNRKVNNPLENNSFAYF